MEIQIQQLQQHLQKNLAPIYLISGDEYLLVDEAITSIREKAAQNDFTSREIFVVDKSFDWQALALELNNLSIFSDKSIIELKINNNKLPEIGNTILQNYAKNPAPEKLLILTTGKLDAAAKKSQWYKSISELGVSITIWKLEPKQFLAWLINRLKKCSLSLEDEGIRLLYDYVEGNLLAAAQEIEKLKILYGTKKITTAELLGALTETSEYSIYDLMEYALQGDITKTIRIFKHLQNESFEPAIMIWAITRELRNLIAISTKKEQGEGIDKILQHTYMRPNQKVAVKKAVLRKNLAQLERILLSVSQIDFSIKGAINTNPWQEIEKVLLAIAADVSMIV